jgi:prophage regulatory protein
MNPHQESRLTILRRTQVEARTGYSRSTIYHRISQGLWTRQVSLGARSVGWPAGEVDALNAARIAGRTDDEIRELVKVLEQYRAKTGVPIRSEANDAL